MVSSVLSQLQIMPDRFFRAFNSSGSTRSVTLDISKAFEKVFLVIFQSFLSGLVDKLKSYASSSLWFGLMLSFLSNRLRLMVGKSFQEYPVKVHKGPIRGPTSVLLWINHLLDNVKLIAWTLRKSPYLVRVQENTDKK